MHASYAPDRVEWYSHLEAKSPTARTFIELATRSTAYHHAVGKLVPRVRFASSLVDAAIAPEMMRQHKVILEDTAAVDVTIEITKSSHEQWHDY